MRVHLDHWLLHCSERIDDRPFVPHYQWIHKNAGKNHQSVKTTIICIYSMPQYQSFQLAEISRLSTNQKFFNGSLLSLVERAAGAVSFGIVCRTVGVVMAGDTRWFTAARWWEADVVENRWVLQLVIHVGVSTEIFLMDYHWVGLRLSSRCVLQDECMFMRFSFINIMTKYSRVAQKPTCLLEKWIGDPLSLWDVFVWNCKAIECCVTAPKTTVSHYLDVITLCLDFWS